jgi:hypothetical protein
MYLPNGLDSRHALPLGIRLRVQLTQGTLKSVSFWPNFQMKDDNYGLGHVCCRNPTLREV